MADKLTVDQWRANYLHGIPDVDPTTNQPFSEENYQYHLDLAYRSLELALDISILPTTITDERHDYYIEDYQAWGWLRTYTRPIRQVISIEGKYPYYQTALRIPDEWIVADHVTGQINLIPAAGTLSQFIMTSGGQLLPHMFRYQSYVPKFWSITYEAGFEDGEIPLDLNDAAAKMACMSVMNILGDLIGGPGVLGASIGLDGLSQFISMTKTATTGAFYARVLQYRTELMGSGMGGPGSQIHTLRRKYRGLRTISL